MNLGHKALLGCQEFKALRGCLELENQARMDSLGSQDFRGAKGSKGCLGCQDPQAFPGLGNRAFQVPKVTRA